jgi:hypothetical protein
MTNQKTFIQTTSNNSGCHLDPFGTFVALKNMNPSAARAAQQQQQKT